MIPLLFIKALENWIKFIQQTRNHWNSSGPDLCEIFEDFCDGMFCIIYVWSLIYATPSHKSLKSMSDRQEAHMNIRLIVFIVSIHCLNLSYYHSMGINDSFRDSSGSTRESIGDLCIKIKLRFRKNIWMWKQRVKVDDFESKATQFFTVLFTNWIKEANISQIMLVLAKKFREILS